MSAANTALALARRGYRVFPLAPNSKRPIIRDFPRKATTDPDTIAKWWSRPGRGIAIATGCGLFVVDPDAKDGKPGLANWQMLADLHGLPAPAFALTTPTGGRHVYFRADEPFASGASKIAPGIDHRCEGGFVKFYGDDLPPPVGQLTPVPAFVAGKVTHSRPKPEPANDVELDTLAAIGRATAWLQDQAPEAIEGAGGDAVTYQVAARVKDFGVSEPVALDLLLEHWNPTKAIPPWPADALAVKVENAYRYGTSSAGAMSPEADFGVPDTLPEDQASAKSRKRLFRESFSEVRPVLDRRALVKGFIGHGAMAVLYGDSNTGKTFFALDLALHIALGWDWHGLQVDQGLAVYVAAESGSSARNRVAAFRAHHGLEADDAPFDLVPCSVDLLDPAGDLNALVAVIREAEAAHGRKAVLVVIDTLARAMGGGNENAPDDMGRFVRHVDAIRARTGAAVLVVHHTGKDKARGARGHSALRAATDTEIEVADRTAKATKQRDFEAGRPIPFGLKPVAIGTDPDGDTVTSCVVTGRQADPNADFLQRVDGLPPKVRKALDLLRRCIDEGGELAPAHPDIPDNVRGVGLNAWRQMFGEIYPADAKPASIDRTFRDARTRLAAANVIAVEGDFVWISP